MLVACMTQAISFKAAAQGRELFDGEPFRDVCDAEFSFGSSEQVYPLVSEYAKGVARLEVVEFGNPNSGINHCTGTLLDNGADADERGYFLLTAWHCFDNFYGPGAENQLLHMRVFWHDVNNGHGACPSAAMLPTTMTHHARLIAWDGDMDHALLRLEQSPPDSATYQAALPLQSRVSGRYGFSLNHPFDPAVEAPRSLLFFEAYTQWEVERLAADPSMDFLTLHYLCSSSPENCTHMTLRNIEGRIRGGASGSAFFQNDVASPSGAAAHLSNAKVRGIVGGVGRARGSAGSVGGDTVYFTQLDVAAGRDARLMLALQRGEAYYDECVTGDGDADWCGILGLGRLCEALGVDAEGCARLNSKIGSDRLPLWEVAEVDGASALRSGRLRSRDDNSCMTLALSPTLSGPVEVAFDWRLPAAHDDARVFAFLVDGQEAGRLQSQQQNWTRFAYTLDASLAEELRWCLQRTEYPTRQYATASLADDDRAWLDALSITPQLESGLSRAEFCDVLDLSGEACAYVEDAYISPLRSAAGSTPWRTVTDVVNAGAEALRVSQLGAGETACVAGRFALPAGDWQLQFHWRVEAAGATASLSFYDGLRRRANAAVGDWRLQRYDFRGGDGTLFRWCLEKNDAAAESGWLDNLKLVALRLESKADFCEAADVGDALCANIDAFSQTPAAPWLNVPSEEAFGGNDALRSAWLGAPGESCLGVRLNGVDVGARRLRFRWRAPRLETGAFSFRVDGAEELSFSQPQPQWTQVEYVFNAAEDYMLHWCFKRNRLAAIGGDDEFDAIWLDDIRLSAGGDFSVDRAGICRALDMDGEDCAALESFKFIPNTLVWSPAPAFGVAGTSSLQLPRQSQLRFNACLQLNIAAPADALRVLLDWRDGDSGANRLLFSLDGARRATLDGDSDWLSLNHPLPSGRRELRFCHDKRSGVFSTIGVEAQLDNLRLVSASELPAPASREDFCRALDVDSADCASISAVASTPSTLPWAEYQRAGARGDSVLSVAQTPAGATATLTFDIEIAADHHLSFDWAFHSGVERGRLRFFIDGGERARLDAGAGEVRIVLGAGAHRLRWEYRNQAVFSRAENHFHIDALRLFPRYPDADADKASLCAALGLDDTVCAAIGSFELDGGDWEFAVDDHISPSQLVSGDDDGVSLRLRLDQPEAGACLHLNYIHDANLLRSRRVSFEWKARNAEDSLSFHLDGVTPTEQGAGARVAQGDGQWRFGDISLRSPGPHRLSWCLRRGAGAADGDWHAVIDNVAIADASGFLPLFGDVCAPLLDDDAHCAIIRRAFYTPDPLRWLPSATPTRTLADGGVDNSHLGAGVDGAAAAAAGSSSCLSLDVNLEQAHAMVSFYWRTEADASLRFEVDGETLARLGAGEEWTRFSGVLSEVGARRLRWCYTNHRASAAVANMVGLDGLLFQAEDSGVSPPPSMRRVYRLALGEDHLDIDEFGDIQGSVDAHLQIYDDGVRVAENPGLMVEFRLSALYTRFTRRLASWISTEMHYAAAIDDNYELSASAPTMDTPLEVQAWVDGVVAATATLTVRPPAAAPTPASYALRAVDRVSGQALTVLPRQSSDYGFYLYVDAFDAAGDPVDNPALFLGLSASGPNASLLIRSSAFISVAAASSAQPKTIWVSPFNDGMVLTIKLLDADGNDTIGVALMLSVGAPPPAIATLSLTPASQSLSQTLPYAPVVALLRLSALDQNNAAIGVGAVSLDVSADNGARATLTRRDAADALSATLTLSIALNADRATTATVTASAGGVSVEASVLVAAAPRLAERFMLSARDAVLRQNAVGETVTATFSLSLIDNYGDDDVLPAMAVALSAVADHGPTPEVAASVAVGGGAVVVAVSAAPDDAERDAIWTLTATLSGVETASARVVVKAPPPVLDILREDGRIDIEEWLVALRHVSGAAPSRLLRNLSLRSGEDLQRRLRALDDDALDLNGDNRFNVEDMRLLMRYALGVDARLPDNLNEAKARMLLGL